MVFTDKKQHEKKWTVYIHISPNNKYYVGITSRQPELRWKNGKGYQKNTYFYRAIQKYGWDNFEHIIIADTFTEKGAKELEIALINKLQCNNYKYGYNISSGGEGKSGVPTSSKQKQVTSERLKKCWQDPEYRKKHTISHSEEWKKEHGRKMKALWQDPEYRRLHTKENSPMYGRNRKEYGMSGETNPNAKKVICLNTGKAYGCIKDAAIDTGASQTDIGECCHFRRKSSGMLNKEKLCWRFDEDYKKLSESDIRKIIFDANLPSKKPQKIINLTQKTLFSSAKNAAQYYEIKNPCTINTAARTGSKIKKCTWKYYNDFLKENKLTEDEALGMFTFIA